MAQRIQYQVVGRYMDGKEVVGYHLSSIDTGKSGRYTKEQVIFLAGRGQLTNCEGQIYQDKVLLRGTNGTSLDSLPEQHEDGKFKAGETIGKVRKGTDAASAMTQLMIVGNLVEGRNTIGYIVRNAGGATKKLKRADVITLASQGKIGNARVQNYKGNTLLRGVNVNLNELPSYRMDGTQVNGENNKAETAKVQKQPVVEQKPAIEQKSDITSLVDKYDRDKILSYSKSINGLATILEHIMNNIKKQSSHNLAIKMNDIVDLKAVNGNVLNPKWIEKYQKDYISEDNTITIWATIEDGKTGDDFSAELDVALYFDYRKSSLVASFSADSSLDIPDIYSREYRYKIDSQIGLSKEDTHLFYNNVYRACKGLGMGL